MDKKIQLIDDTICAVCSPSGIGSIAVIRVSGPKSFKIIEKIFFPANKKKFSLLESRKAYIGDIVYKEKILDESLCLLFKSPNSLTGQDLVELHTHGGVIVPEMVISALVDLGARIAEPGEFSYRSYQNGKIDLLKAEAVSTLIASQTEEAAGFSTTNISGEISKKFNNLSTLGINLLAEIEARVDFPEDEIPDIDRYNILKHFDTLDEKCNELLNTYSKGRLAIDGIRVLILGEPNTGKSTLLNKILSEERAIVSDQPGTTRDILEAEITYLGKKIIFSDTAGIRSVAGEVEREGIRRAKEKVDYSDLVLIVDKFDSNWEKVARNFEFVPRGKRLFVGNKIDLGNIENTINLNFKETIKNSDTVHIQLLSAKMNIGIDDLLENIVSLTYKDKNVDFDEGVLTTKRQVGLLSKALGSLRNGKKGFSDNLPLEIVSVEIREFLNLVGAITGEVTTEDIYDSLFSKFCIGK